MLPGPTEVLQCQPGLASVLGRPLMGECHSAVSLPTTNDYITLMSYCQICYTQRGLNSANELSALLVRRLGMLSLLVYTILQTPVNSKNHLRPSCLNEYFLVP